MLQMDAATLTHNLESVMGKHGIGIGYYQTTELKGTNSMESDSTGAA